MANDYSIKEDLLYKLRITKWCRINAYKRCVSWKRYLQLISFLYNLSLIILSVLSLSLFKDNSIVSILIVILSVIVFSTSLYVSSLDYSRRANEYKICYTQLAELESVVQSTKKTEKVKLEYLFNQYNTIMQFSINHDEYDYVRYMKEYPIDKYYFAKQKDNGAITEKEKEELINKAIDQNNSFISKYRKSRAKEIVIKASLLLFVPFFIYYLIWGILFTARNVCGYIIVFFKMRNKDDNKKRS